MSKPILVTGSQGFVGRNVRAALGRRGKETLGVDLAGSGAEIELDLSDDGFDPEALAERAGAVDGIIYLAARISRGSSVDRDARKNLQAIAISAVRTKEAFERVHAETHFVFCSSIKVYGAKSDVIEPEDGPMRPEQHSYGSAKALAERLLTVSARRSGAPFAIVRPSFVYGPGQRPTTAIPIFLAACLRGERPVVFGSGRELRDDVFVSDVAHCLVEACLRRASGAFHATGEGARSLAEVAELCCQAVEAAGGPRGIRPLLDPARVPKPWLDQRFDLARTRAILDYEPTSLSRGLELHAKQLAAELSGTEAS